MKIPMRIRKLGRLRNANLFAGNVLAPAERSESRRVAWRGPPCGGRFPLANLLHAVFWRHLIFGNRLCRASRSGAWLVVTAMWYGRVPPRLGVLGRRLPRMSRSVDGAAFIATAGCVLDGQRPCWPVAVADVLFTEFRVLTRSSGLRPASPSPDLQCP